MKKRTHISEIDIRRIGLSLLIILSLMGWAAVHAAGNTL